MSDFEKSRVGVIVPLYVSPQQHEASWVQLAGTARRYPRVHIIAAVDVNQGPGLGPDGFIQRGVDMLKNNAVTVLGFIQTGMEKFSVNEVKQDMINWQRWYPQLDGFYLDGVPREGGNVQYLQDIVDYAKRFLGVRYIAAELDHEARDLGGGVKVANAGIPRDLVDRTHTDLFIIYQGRGIPAPLSVYKTAAQRSEMGNWSEEDFPSYKFGIICTKIDISQSHLAENFVRQAVNQNVARYFYMQTDAGARDMHPEPFTMISSMFEPTVRILDDIAAAESKIPPPPPLAEPMTPTESTPGEGPAPPDVFVERTGVEPELPSEDDRDVFGVRKIYLTREGGREWFFRQDGRDPAEDKYLRNTKNSNLRRMQDGTNSWYVNGMANKKGQVRLEAWSPKTRKWLNTETTAYLFYIEDIKSAKENDDKSQYAYQIYTRSGEHSSKKTQACQGACYKSAIYKDGRSTIRKEVAHPFYCPNRATQPAITSHPVKGNWVGLKQCVYNIAEDGEPNTYVVIENWVDQNCTTEDGRLVVRNDWKMVSRFVDRGTQGDREGLGWGLLKPADEKKLEKLKCKSLDSSRMGQPRKSGDIINTEGGTEEGNCAVIESDGVELKFMNFSVREIQPPAKD